MSHKLLIFLIAPFFVVSLIHLCQLIYQAKFNVNHTIADYYEKGLFLYTNLISFIYIPVIVYKMYTMITSYENNAKNVIQKVQEETRWLKQLIHIGIGIVTLGMISVVYILITQAHTSFVAYPFFISLSIWIYWVGYIGINKSSSHKKLEILAKNQMSKKIGHPTFIKINEHILREKKYLVQDIGLTTIASHFDLSSGYLSQLINRHTKKSFNDYINELRIKAAKRMLSDIRYNNYTIESIGLECGFKSKSNFYTSFKKFSGQTPNQYKKHQKISSGS
ncbi:helix-turn-helix domain-containing protein [Aquimarina pacifica]|uniref:helix-turn-helix domain-containing protein n=1 Tax=Aquimarina pacifica TaxID=1296415 RepID=UPI0013768FA2|nr:AraC family transcriptional regulator [Aquimarina pacifica]